MIGIYDHKYNNKCLIKKKYNNKLTYYFIPLT